MQVVVEDQIVVAVKPNPTGVENEIALDPAAILRAQANFASAVRERVVADDAVGTFHGDGFGITVRLFEQIVFHHRPRRNQLIRADTETDVFPAIAARVLIVEKIIVMHPEPLADVRIISVQRDVFALLDFIAENVVIHFHVIAFDIAPILDGIKIERVPGDAAVRGTGFDAKIIADVGVVRVRKIKTLDGYVITAVQIKTRRARGRSADDLRATDSLGRDKNRLSRRA